MGAWGAGPGRGSSISKALLHGLGSMELRAGLQQGGLPGDRGRVCIGSDPQV